MNSYQKFSSGALVWIPSEAVVFVQGVVLSQDDDRVCVRVESTPGKSFEVVVSASDCHAKDAEPVDDMTKLVYLHEAGVLHNLESRYIQSSIYTYTGSILIAVNPFQRFKSLYDEAMRKKYHGARLGQLPPHIFAISDSAYKAMMTNKVHQSILISGESGAGKTETTKLVMEYLAGVGGRAKASAKNVESKVLESNPLLEAFGNAKTVRNDNSSRFGKYIQIQFNKRGRLSGAAIRTYLLERSRVVKINSPERNFHCFYQLCDGASEEEAQKFRLPLTKSRAKEFHYLNKSECFELDGISNTEEYQRTVQAMDVLGITKEQQESVWKVISAILHLGNVTFAEAEDHNEPLKPSSDISKEHLDTVAELLKCDREWLEKSLVHRYRKISSQVVAGRIDVKSAHTMRDSLAKNLYSKLFDWIVDRVNGAIGEDLSSEVSIGVLDIYGFEHFEQNSFEQFCINLANEKLQQHFNTHVLNMEQEEYERERINWSRIPFADNKDRLDLIEKEKGSILSVLDSDSKLGTKSAEGFTRTLQKEFSDHPRFFSAKSANRTEFTLDHYAGKVKYCTDEFLSKNVDAVVPEHHRLLSESADPVIKELFSDELVPETGFTSIGLSFKRQLSELMDTLNATEPHYVRCIKPNSSLKPQVFERHLVMAQLRSGGVLEAIRMCSAGYPTRRTFSDFLDRFWVLARQERRKSWSEKQLCELLMEQTLLSDYQVGLSKIFLRSGQMVSLDTTLSEQNEAAARIQRRVRTFWFRRERRQASLALQAWWRGVLGHLAYEATLARLTEVATLLQKNVRMKKQRVQFLALRAAALFLQKLVRRRIERDLALVAQIRHGMDLKTSSRAELLARARLDKTMDLIRRLEGSVDSKAQQMVAVQMELKAAREGAAELAKALERITGEPEEFLETVQEEEVEEEQAEASIENEQLLAMEQLIKEMERKLLIKEQEVKALTKRLTSIPAVVKQYDLPVEEQQSILLAEVAASKFGFSPEGCPVAAAVIFRSLLHWNTFATERTNTFDCIVDALQQASKGADHSDLSYWLSVSLNLYLLVDRRSQKSSRRSGGLLGLPFPFLGGNQEEDGRETVDSLLFKLQLWTSVERLFDTIRDAIKMSLAAYLGGQFTAGGDRGAQGNGEVQRVLQFSSSLRVQVADMWSAVLGILQEQFEELRHNHVPPVLVYFLFKQALAFINFRVFNSLMSRSLWCPCSVSNGTELGTGLAKVFDWVSSQLEPWITETIVIEAPLVTELSHLQQAVFFLLMEDKPRASMDDICGTCPSLSLIQLVHLCIWLVDEKHSGSGVDPSVIELMWAHCVDKESPLVLKDEDSLPFSLEDIVESVEEVSAGSVNPPPELLEKGFYFLLQDMRND